jgi:hypothetical protein
MKGRRLPAGGGPRRKQRRQSLSPMSKSKQPKLDQPHAGVDRRRNDMAGRKYSGTRWDELRSDAPVPELAPPPKKDRP